MEQFPFVMTIFFMLLGPVKVIPAFAQLTRDRDEAFARTLAVRGALVASAVVALVALVGESLLGNYQISLEALQLAAGLVLLLAALNTIFPRVGAQPERPPNPTLMQMVVSPLVLPTIVPPAGVAAVLVFMMLAPEFPGIEVAVAVALAIVMVLDFLVMFFNRAILSVPGLMLVLQLLGAVLVFMQVALALDTMLSAFESLGLV